jgi:D-glycero-D-manno-heptose 1,7-bisphosphate phosphatase
VFLDRDGVLNKAIVRGGLPYSPHRVDEVAMNPSARESVQILKNLDLVPIVVTNQPEISRGKISLEDALEINKYIADCLEISHVFMCPHDDQDCCDCRKPKPGLILAAALELNLELENSFLIGDRWKDITAGNLAGCTTIFLRNGYSEPHPSDADYSVSSLQEAVSLLESILT